MGFTFDTVIKTIPANEMKQLTKEQLEEKDKQERVASIHPACPKPISYVGSRLGNYGEAYDYYQDEEKTYWYESRLATEPIVTEFTYGGGGKTCKEKTHLPLLRKEKRSQHRSIQQIAGKSGCIEDDCTID